jgi:protein SOK2
MKPRVTATLWEDEGSLCFQVEANGVCVARREDNHMINGTKLLNVAGMTRGRRDGILKSEKTRHVVKIGPMHLKGVWIPFERALDFANKEKITEMLYPLFVHNIGALLYHPTNSQSGRASVGNASMAGRRPEDDPNFGRPGMPALPPSMPHHHAMNAPVSQPPHSIAPQPTGGRPSIDRAHTFPTPPTSTSGMMGMVSATGSYDYGNVHQGQPLGVDGSMAARSVPTTPATTPPDQQSIQYQTSQSAYDNQRQMYSTPSQHGGYYAQPQQNMNRFTTLQSSPNGGPLKSDMGPPGRASVDDHADGKPHDGYGGQQDADGEHEGEYIHTSALSGAAAQRRSSEPFSNQVSTGHVHSDPASAHHLSPNDMTHSPGVNGAAAAGSGRATPRTSYTGAYNSSTPQRAATLPSSNLNYVMSNDVRANGGAPVSGEYPSAAHHHQHPHHQQHHYQPGPPPPQPTAAPSYPSVNGTMINNNNKRGRDDDSSSSYHQDDAASSLKRQRMEPVARPLSQPVKAGGARR